MQIFKASMDKLGKTITIGTFIGLLTLDIFILSKNDIANASIVMGLILLIFLISYVLSPFAYQLTGDKLIINKKLFPKTIVLSEIHNVSTVEYDDLGIRYRIWGSGGLFGWYGYFYSTDIGKILLQCSKRKNLVKITTNNNKLIVLSPDDDNLFIKSINQYLKERV